MNKQVAFWNAWEEVNRIFPYSCSIDHESSQRAGYPIYRADDPEIHAYICNLGDRLELNFPDGTSRNIWYGAEPERKEPEPYRVDVFPSGKPHLFSDLGEAIHAGRNAEKSGKVAFLLKHVLDGKYEVVCRLD